MRRKWIIGVCVLGLLAVWVLWANTALEINEWTIQSEAIPAAFDGFRIAQVSDLHNTSHWPDTVEALQSAEPDIIVLTGDLIDSRKTDVEAALAFVREASEIAPCCYVTGNHESRIEEWEELRLGLIDAGVMVLEDEKISLERSGEQISVIGLSDPDFRRPFADSLRMLTAQEERFTILLSHRPESIELYAACGIDLVFSGHAHGGQIRIPFIGGLIAPHQGFFPKYDSGLYRVGDTAMLVSRGVGNSIIPLRINNRPEIIVAVLEK